MKLSDVCSKITDGSHNPPQGIEHSEYLMLSSKNIFDDSITLTDPRYLSKQDFANENRRTNVAVNDLLITIVGTVGRVAIVPADHPPICLQRSVAVLKLDNEKVDSRFMMYQLQNMKSLFEAEAHGVAQKGIYLKQLESVKIDCPPLSTQKEIAANLDKATQTIDLCNAILEKLDLLVKARFVEMFGKAFPEDTLINLCNIIDYRGKTPEKAESGLPFITAKNIKMHYMSLEPQEFITKQTYDEVMVRGFPKEGDVVFTTEAPLGNVCRIPHFDSEFYIGQRIVTLQAYKMNSCYLEYALSDEKFIRQYQKKSSGSTVIGIRVRLLEQLTVPVPPLELQNQFAAFVEKTDRTKAAVKQVLAKAETLKKALMQEYFG